jgi:hypothetical protein
MSAWQQLSCVPDPARLWSSNVLGTERSIYTGYANQDAARHRPVYVRPTTPDIEEGEKVTAPRFLVLVDVKLADIASTQEILKDGRT